MSVLLPLGGGLAGAGAGQQIGLLRAYSDPVIFRDDRVLKTLLRKEIKYLPASTDYFSQVQNNELRPHMRKEVAHWMLEVCEAEHCQPEIFCLAINYLDRFLSLCKIAQSQLQLLASVCLLVACKVRGHVTLPASKLVEYSDFNLDVLNIMEWEVLLLSKLDWDMSSVIASDFVEHIIQRVRQLPLGWNPELIRRHSETLVAMCSAHHSFYALAPSLVAAACVLTTLRPLLEATEVQNPDPDTKRILPSLQNAIDIVEKIIFIDKMEVLQCMENIETLMKNSEAVSSPAHVFGTPKKQENNQSDEEETPTKVIEVAEQSHN